MIKKLSTNNFELPNVNYDHGKKEKKRKKKRNLTRVHTFFLVGRTTHKNIFDKVINLSLPLILVRELI